eukprot:8630270-Alexandrium_andersonii.AAC.1
MGAARSPPNPLWPRCKSRARRRDRGPSAAGPIAGPAKSARPRCQTRTQHGRPEPPLHLPRP